MQNVSRGRIGAALVPDQWVCVFQKEDPYGDPAFFFHRINVHLEASPRNTANTIYMVQESEGGSAWTTVFESLTNPIVPGGKVNFDFTNVRRYVRLLVFSHGAGQVHGALLTPEAQVLPQLLENVALACASYCEASCETGNETTAA